MKTIKIFFAAVIVCAATFVGYNTYKQATMTEQERLMQANLEALTGDEAEGEDSWICSTYTSEVYSEECSGYNPDTGEWCTWIGAFTEVRECNSGFLSYCYPGNINSVYDMNGECTHYVDNTYISGCN